MLDMQEVFDAIITERFYQLGRWGVRQADGSFKENEHTVGDFIVYMRHYLTEAEKALTTKSGTAEALLALRKVVTLGVACFEQHGVEKRDLNKLIINGHDGNPA